MKFFANNNSQKGFTLIELLLYVSIFSLIIGAVVGLAIESSTERVQNQITADVNYQGEAVMALIVQDIDNAIKINSPSISNSSNALSLSTSNPATNPTIFNAFTDTSTVRAEITEGSPGVVNYLTNSKVIVSNLSFTNDGASGSQGSVLIQFTLSYLTTSKQRNFNYSKTFYGAASIK